ncbi:hypothetical protein MKW94_028989 [Papaver nudicaule]|uniref:Uncharacterized protein n=1 Tax=Papaver nudicaule TaxID=74823 RepID=A0AA41VMX5_PAPNU|nr:hypothetical protein [Papaver nudicaule]
MASSGHDQSSQSDDSGADEPQQQSEVHYQHPPPAPGILHPGVASSSVEYMIPHYEVGHAVGQAYPYPDPYYRSIFAYGAQPMEIAYSSAEDYFGHYPFMEQTSAIHVKTLSHDPKEREYVFSVYLVFTTTGIRFISFPKVVACFK